MKDRRETKDHKRPRKFKKVQVSRPEITGSWMMVISIVWDSKTNLSEMSAIFKTHLLRRKKKKKERNRSQI